MKMEHQRSDAGLLIAEDSIGDHLWRADKTWAERSRGNKGDAIGVAVLFKLIGKLDSAIGRIRADDMT